MVMRPKKISRSRFQKQRMRRKYMRARRRVSVNNFRSTHFPPSHNWIFAHKHVGIFFRALNSLGKVAFAKKHHQYVVVRSKTDVRGTVFENQNSQLERC